MRITFKKSLSGRHHTCRPKPPLYSPCIYNRFLQRVKFARRPQAFNGCESTPASLSSEHDAAGARHAIHQNGTGTALTCLAAMFDTIVTFLAQYRHQRFVGGTFEAFNNPINTQFELHFYFPSSDMPCETLVAFSSTR